MKYIELFKEFQNVLAWSYEDLKSYDTSVIQHTIPLKENQKSFKQKPKGSILYFFLSLRKKSKKCMKLALLHPSDFCNGYPI